MLNIERLRCEYMENPVGIAEAHPHFGWVIESDLRNVLQATYRVQVALDDGFGTIAWDSGQVASDESVSVVYGGSALEHRTRYYWRARIRDTSNADSGWSRKAFFETAMGADEWRARFISAEGESSWADSKGTLLRKEFELPSGFASARVYVSALGLYELRLNGREVGDEVLAPGWTSYDKRLLYQSYDVTGLLREGTNAIGATVAAGWYKGDLAGWLGRRNLYGARTALVAQLMVRYTDGEEIILATDETWRASEGPVLFSEIYHGEIYDARLEAEGWDKPGFDDSGWRPASVLERNLSVLAPRDGLPVRRRERFKAVSLIVTPKGERVLDFGQNIAGRVRFAVSGKRGDRVVLRHAEILDAQGNFYTANLRTARARVVYVLGGSRTENYEPRFTYMGFRYVCVDEWPGPLEPDVFEAVAIYSDMEATGSFECSSEMLNRLHTNIVWGLRGNFVDIPSDCPQRDERLGWTGDAQVFIGTAAFLMGVDPFFRKWLRDLTAEQKDSGAVPLVIPNVLADLVAPDGQMMTTSSGWGDAATICPWTVYVRYGDRALLEEQYPSMRAWLEYIRAQAKDGLIWDSGFHCGDWVALDAKEGSYFGATPNDFVATAFYAKSADIVAKAAAVLGRELDAREYSALRNRIVEAFNAEFFTPAGRIAVRTQTACVLALDFALARPEQRDQVRDTLLALIKEKDGHLVTGFLGTPYLCRALAESGALDVAYALLMREEYPSWLYQVRRGATTVWEHWDGLKPDGSMWSPDMNSFNHYAYGSIGEWLHSSVAGLAADEDQPGYKHIRFKPRPGGGLTRAAASLETVRGLAAMDWRIEGAELRIEVTVPHNATATLEAPGAAPVEVGSGRNAFAYPWPVRMLP